MTASRLEWSVEKTRSMYDKHVKQTRSGKKSSVGKVKKIPARKPMVCILIFVSARLTLCFTGGQDAPQTIGSCSTADLTVVEGKGGRRNVVAAPEEDDNYEGEGGSDYLDGPKDIESYTDDGEDEDDQDIEWNENNVNKIMHSISNVKLRTSTSNLNPLPSDPQDETPTFIIPALDPEEAASLNLGLHDPTPLRTESEKTDTVPRVDDLTQLQLENERNDTVAAVPEAQSEHTPESSMSAEQRIKQLEEKVAKLNALRLVDAASISRSSHILSIFFFPFIY